MKRTTCRTLLLAVILPALSLLSAQERCLAQVFDDDYRTGSQDQLVMKGGVALHSDRWFRGQNLYNGTSIQPQAEVGFGTGMGLLYAGGFAHFSGDNNTEDVNRKDFSEFDYEVGHRFDLEDIQLAIGHRWLTYSRTTARLRDSAEVYVELTTAYILHPHFTATYDHDENEGWYYEVGLEQPIPLGLNNERDAVVPWVTMGMSSDLDDDEHPIYDENGIAFLDVGLRGIFELTENLSLEPEMHYSSEVDDATTSDFIFGINLKGSVGETTR